MKSTFLAVSFVLACAAVALADDARWPIEVSKDGQQTVEVRPSPTDGMAIITRAAVPFGATPDWQNNIRRQVGALEIADMNGDGWNDLVVGVFHTDSFPPYDVWKNLVYFNIGGQLEANPSWVSTDQVSTSDVKVGDINKDTYPDVFAGNGAGLADNVIYFGSASGPSQTAGWVSNEPLNCWTNATYIFDFDHDNDLDVLTCNQAVSPDPYRKMYMFKNNNGVLNPVPQWESAESSIQNFIDVYDYDGDGWEDVAVSKWANFESGIYKNVNGTLQTTPVWTVGDTNTDRGVAWADFDGDGWKDLALGRSPTRYYANRAGTLMFEWQADPNLNYGAQDFRAADLNKDGRPELAEIAFSTGRIYIYLNEDGHLTTTPAWIYDDPAVGNAIAFGDINGDGWLDLAAGFSGDPSIKVFYAVPTYCYGDMNCDGAVNFKDINKFVEALSGQAAWEANPDNAGCAWLNGDANEDGIVSFKDINPFVALLGTTCN